MHIGLPSIIPIAFLIPPLLLTPHRPPPSLTQGALRVSRFNPFEGCVGSDSVGQDILVSGRVDMNRALDGEEGVVCVGGGAGWTATDNRP